MRKWLLVFINLFLFSCGYGQKDTLFFNEFSLSVNLSNVKNSNTENREGMGIGAYHSFCPTKLMEGIIGLEFNRTSQFKKIVSDGHFSNFTNVTYFLNNFSLPISARVNFGKTFKPFFEGGGYCDFSISSKMKGTFNTYGATHSQIEINEKAGLAIVNYGPSFGMGIRIPVSKHELIIKTDFKLGLRKLTSEGEFRNSYERLILGFKI